MDSREGLIKGSLYCPDNVQQTEREQEICEGLCGSGGDHQPCELQERWGRLYWNKLP